MNIAPNRPKRLILDLRPLQTSYAMHGVGRYTFSITKELIKVLRAKPLNKDDSEFEINSLVFAHQPNPFPELPATIKAPHIKRQWIWDQTLLPLLLWKNKIDLFQNFVAIGPLDRISFPLLYAHKTFALIHDWHVYRSNSAICKFYRSTWRIRLQGLALCLCPQIYGVSNLVNQQTQQWLMLKQNRWPFKWLKEKLPASLSPEMQVRRLSPGSNHLSDNNEELNKKLKRFGEILPPSSTQPNRESVEGRVFKFLSVGSSANKNLSFSFKSLKKLTDEGFLVHWTIIGNEKDVSFQLGYENAFLMKLEHPWVSVLSYPSDKDLKKIYQESDVLLFHSYEEGFGLPLLEGMTYGCLVCCLNKNPMKENVENAGILTNSPNETAKKLKQVFAKPEKWQEYLQRGALQVQKFRWESSAKQLFADWMRFLSK